MAGVWDLITGQNPNQGAVNSANQAASQASDAQNQLIQQGLLPIYNQELSTYNQDYAPAGTQAVNELNNVGQAANTAANAYSNADAATGINQQGIDQANLSYLSNPNATNLSQTYGGVGQNEANAQNQYYNYGNAATGAVNNAASAGIQGNSSASGTIGASQNALNNLGNNATIPFYLREQQQGLTPQSIGAAQNAYQSTALQDLNSIRNGAGAGAANPIGALSDFGEQAIQGSANLGSQLAGMNQGYQNQGAAGALSAAEGLNSSTQNAALSQAGLGQNSAGLTNNAASLGNTIQSNINTSEQQLGQQQLSNAAGLDTQTAQMLGGAQAAGAQAQQQDLSNIAASFGIDQAQLGDLMNYIGQGNNLLTGTASGEQGLANQYGQAATGAANNAQNAINSGQNANNQTAGLGASIASFFV
jgi:hypothetical protein